jgi:uncharacterized protein (TIRG00374 family)
MVAAEWKWLAGAWLCLLASYGVRIYRWFAIVQSIGAVPVGKLGTVYMAGLLANNVLPARTGEVVRAAILSQVTQIQGAAALGTIAVERAFDVIMALVLLTVGVGFGVLSAVGSSLWLGAALVAVLLGALAILATWGERLSGTAERLVGRVSPTWGQRLGDLGRSFVSGLRSIDSLGRALRVLVASAATWGLFMAYAALVLRAYGMGIDLAGAAFLLGLAGLGVSVPSAPGNVGTLEGANILALRLLGIGDASSRASFALTYHVLEWATTCALGLLCLGRLGLSLGQLSRMSQGLEQAVDGG